MEKFMELLREYNMSNQSPYILGDADYYVDGGLYAPQIISKSYWFIKWLVDNEKIDTNKLEKIWYEKTVYEDYWQYREIVEYSDYEALLMLLSIQDGPLNFLCEILKQDD